MAAKTDEFFSFQDTRPTVSHQCVACRDPSIRAFIRAALERAVAENKRVCAQALGEYLRANYEYPCRPENISKHLSRHETELWVQVRG